MIANTINKVPHGGGVRLDLRNHSVLAGKLENEEKFTLRPSPGFMAKFRARSSI